MRASLLAACSIAALGCSFGFGVALSSRYQLQTTPNGEGVLLCRLDRWTGKTCVQHSDPFHVGSWRRVQEPVGFWERLLASIHPATNDGINFIPEPPSGTNAKPQRDPWDPAY